MSEPRRSSRLKKPSTRLIDEVYVEPAPKKKARKAAEEEVKPAKKTAKGRTGGRVVTKKDESAAQPTKSKSPAKAKREKQVKAAQETSKAKAKAKNDAVPPTPKATPKKRTKAAKKDDADDDDASDASASPAPTPKTKKSPKAKATPKASGKDAERRAELNGMSLAELKELLRNNDQLVSGTKGELTKRILECTKRGCLPKCTKCGGGRLKPSGSKYNCPGYFDDGDYMRCSASFAASDITFTPWTFTSASGLL